LGLILLALFVCLDAWQDIVRIVQQDPEASHIVLVPLVFARLVWVRRKMLIDWLPRGSLLGVLLALAGVGLWVLGYIKAMQVVWHFGALLTVFGAFVSVYGIDIVRRLWPAFFVLLFLMPLPGVVRHPMALFLQNASAKATEVVIVALGFELRRQGNLLMINDYTVGIAEACNGMRMVSMLILIVFAFVFSEKVRTWVRLSLIIGSIPIAILCNIVRLVPTVLAYGYFSPKFAEQLHDWLGWGLAFASYFGLMGLLWLMRWLLLPVDPLPEVEWRPTGSQSTAWMDHLKSKYSALLAAPEHRVVSLAGILLVLAAGLAVGFLLPDGGDAEPYHARLRTLSEQLPREAGPWTAVDTELPAAAVALLRPNVLISRRYEDETKSNMFQLLLVQCSDARDMEGHYPPNCYPTSGWTTLSQQREDFQLGHLSAEMTTYSFERLSPDGLQKITVVNVIALPSGGFVTSMGSIRRLAGTVSDRYYGAAQLQFVFPSQWTSEQRHGAIGHVGATLEPMLTAVLNKNVETADPKNLGN